jgi:membrane fusion protein (multidrug efflux system)
MFKKITLTALGLLVILGSIVGVKVLQITTMVGQTAKFTPPPTAVTTDTVRVENWRLELASVGSLAAVQGVTVSAELDGKVVGIPFVAGTPVRAGDLLVRQDTSVEAAQLRAAEAGVALARISLERSRELLAKSAISQSQLDSDEATAKQAEAQADNIRATIAKKTIRAPFSGSLGVRLINVGQILKAGDPIVSLQALDPIFVDFYLPQQELAGLSTGLKVVLAGDSIGAGPVEGTITAINPDVDAATRNVRVQATIANPAGALRPGMFVNVEVQLPRTRDVLVIPATSVLSQPYGDTVYVVEEKADPVTGVRAKVVRQQVVRVGEQRGDFVAIESGLEAGETVVTTGVFKLRPGMTVSSQNDLAPDAQLAPQPGDS